MQIVRFKITGLTPLLMHKCWPEDLEAKESTGKKKRNPQQEAEHATHRMPDSTLCLPSEGFLSGLLMGAKGFKWGKDKCDQYISPALAICTEFCPLFYPDSNKPIMKFDEVFSKPAHNRKTNSRINTYRPKTNKWACFVDLEVDERFIPDPESLLAFFTRAGTISGAGSFRPQHKGPFGKYSVEIVKI